MPLLWHFDKKTQGTKAMVTHEENISYLKEDRFGKLQ